MSTILKILLISIQTIQIWIQINFDMTLSKIHQTFKISNYYFVCKYTDCTIIKHLICNVLTIIRS